VSAPPVIDGRAPPHDLDAEAAVLSACMIEPRTIDEVRGVLRAEHFYSEAHRRIFEACVDLHVTGQPIDVVQVGSWLRRRERLAQVGGMAYLTEVLNAVPAISNARAYAGTVVDHARVRKIVQTAQTVAAEGYQPIPDASSFLEGVEKRVLAVTREDVSLDFQDYGDLAFNLVADAQRRAATGEVDMGEPTGYTPFDRILHGYERSRVTIVAARPGFGKTAFALNTGSYVARPRFVHEPYVVVPFFSLEMPEDQLARRLLCMDSGLDHDKLRYNRLSVEDWPRLIDAANRGRSRKLKLLHTPGLTVERLSSMLHRLKRDVEKEGGRMPLFIIDYVQLMKADRAGNRHGNREQEVGEISRSIKQVAGETKAHALLLSQLNRNLINPETGKSRRPQLSDLRESGSLEQDADNIVFIDKTRARAPLGPQRIDEPSAHPPRIVDMIVAKVRDGDPGGFRLAFETHCSRFSMIAPGSFAGDESFNPEEDE
jgi:replicative DNA helicase